MFYILFIIKLLFGTSAVPTTVADGIQNAVYTEGGMSISSKQIHQIIVCDIADDDDSDDGNDAKNTVSTISCNSAIVSLELFRNPISSVSTFFSGTHLIVQRRLFILFQVLKLDYCMLIQ